MSVHLDASHASDVPFLFEQQQKRMLPAMLLSLGSQVACVLLAVLFVRYSRPDVHDQPVLPDKNPNQIIWLVQPGPGGGGGGGGNKMKEPPRKAELPGKDKITVPVQKPPSFEAPQIVKNEPIPIPTLNIPAKELAASQDSLPGAIAAPSTSALSQGSGSGGGAGTGTGTGIGPGTGSGLGPGSGGGTGGGTYRLGSGVTTPQLVREVKPQYTSDAMRAKIQGEVWVECVIKADGSVGDVQVIRSLDSTFGLDQEAIKAVRQWRFRPGTLKGEPVPVTVQVAVSFTLR
ncbi:MAG: TonB family protein [Acidobacteriota bacterium]